MTTPAVGASSFHPTRAYITTSYYKSRPTGLAVDNLVPGVRDPRLQDEELAKIIVDASSEMDEFCYGATGGTIYATVDTEALWLTPDRFGCFRVSPPFLPVTSVTAFASGPDQLGLIALTDLSNTAIERDKFRVFTYPFNGVSSAGPLEFGGPRPGYGGQAWVQYSYVNGWPLTWTTADITAGATSVQVADPTGIYVGRQLILRDVPNGDDTVTVTSVSGNTIGVSPTVYQHSAGTYFDGLPGAVVEACVEIVTGMLKRRAQEGVKPTSKARESLESPGQDNFTTGFMKLKDFVMVRSR